MACYRCPHYVKHGRLDQDTGKLTFSDSCALKMKEVLQTADSPMQKKTKPRSKKASYLVGHKPDELEKLKQSTCDHAPFKALFDYLTCDVYQNTFESAGYKNSVLPTKDFEYAKKITSSSVVDMELL